MHTSEFNLPGMQSTLIPAEGTPKECITSEEDTRKNWRSQVKKKNPI